MVLHDQVDETNTLLFIFVITMIVMITNRILGLLLLSLIKRVLILSLFVPLLLLRLTCWQLGVAHGLCPNSLGS